MKPTATSPNGLELADVAIIGAGPAGAATALVLARAGLDVLLVERSSGVSSRPGETLSPSVRLALEALGLRQDFEEAGHLRSAGTRSAWGSAEAVENASLYDPYGPGWHVDRALFDAWLRDAAIAAGARLRLGVKAAGADLTSSAWRLRLIEGTRVQSVLTRFVVDASGRSAAFARSQGAKCLRFDRLVGVVGTFEHSSGSRPAECVALIEAVADGWWYSAPIPGDRLVVAFLSDADLVARHKAHSLAAWQGLLRTTRHTSARASGYVLSGDLVAAVAASSALLPVAGKGWLAVGDAAIGRDPLSGQGIESSMRAGPRAARAMLDHLAGDPDALEAYRREHARDVFTYLAMRDSYYRQEQRWPDSPFWARRHAQPGPRAAGPA
jgi:flavin-dependent dehydrogenase